MKNTIHLLQVTIAIVLLLLGCNNVTNEKNKSGNGGSGGTPSGEVNQYGVLLPEFKAGWWHAGSNCYCKYNDSKQLIEVKSNGNHYHKGNLAFENSYGKTLGTWKKLCDITTSNGVLVYYGNDEAPSANPMPTGENSTPSTPSTPPTPPTPPSQTFPEFKQGWWKYTFVGKDKYNENQYGDIYIYLYYKNSNMLYRVRDIYEDEAQQKKRSDFEEYKNLYERKSHNDPTEVVNHWYDKCKYIETYGTWEKLCTLAKSADKLEYCGNNLSWVSDETFRQKMIAYIKQKFNVDLTLDTSKYYKVEFQLTETDKSNHTTNTGNVLAYEKYDNSFQLIEYITWYDYDPDSKKTVKLSSPKIYSNTQNKDIFKGMREYNDFDYFLNDCKNLLAGNLKNDEYYSEEIKNLSITKTATYND